MGLRNARFEVVDVTRLPSGQTFDLITSFDAIHDQRDPAAVLRCAAAALAPDGIYLAVEPRASSNLEDNVGNPFAPWLYGISVLHCMTVSLAEAGFTSVEAVEAPGPQNSIYICRRLATLG